MKISLSVTAKFSPKKPKSTPPTVVVFCDDNGKVLGNIDKELHERASTLIERANFKGGLGSNIADFAVSDKTLSPLVVIGTGKLEKLASNIEKVAHATYSAIKDSQKAVIVWGNVICQKHFGQFVRGIFYKAYRFDHYKKEPAKDAPLKSIEFVNNKDSQADYEHTLAYTQAVIIAQNTARDLANEPPNVANPSYLAKQAKQLAKDYADTVEVSILDEKKMEKLGMGCFLSVSKGSVEEGKLVVIEYYGKTKKGAKAGLQAPIALVGKGITFDTGGISLKPGANMDEMKYDMGGAAAMLGTITGVCEAKLPLDIVVVLACAENMPSGNASRPGDIVTAMDGTTVEILNTDAEGRLVLCDALCYVQENYSPSVIVDAATLTGACVVALGSHRSGLYCNDEDTLVALESAGEYTADVVWHMPLDEAYASQLKSPFADLQNIGGPKGGSITAACFLQHFIKNDTPWAHFDIAGTAWNGGENKGATGRPVPLLMQFLKSQVK